MYERIASNKRKTWALIFGFVLIVGLIGWAFGQYLGYGFIGLAVALGIAILMTWGSYFNSDKIALAMSHAKPADDTKYQQLNNIVESLSIAAGIPKPRVYVVEDSAPNAFATGRNPEHAAIAVTTGLLEKLNRDELEGVIAHELSHVKNRDILIMTIAVTLVGVIILLADIFIRALWWGGGRGGNRNSGGGAGAILAIFGLVLLVLGPLIGKIMQFAISRRREYLADADGVFLTRYPDGLISALEKLKADQTVVKTGSRATAHLWIETPIPTSAADARQGKGRGAWLNRMFETHPPLDDRIAVLKESALAGSMPPEAPT